MRRAERLFRPINKMRARGISRAHELAEHFEVRISTIYRAIGYLQTSGLPTEGEAGVGCLLRPGFDLPNVTFTHDQVDALAVDLSFVESAGDPVLATAAREMRAEIQAGMPQPEEHKLADVPYFNLQGGNATPNLALLRRAIRQRQIAQFNYRDSDGNQPSAAYALS